MATNQYTIHVLLLGEQDELQNDWIRLIAIQNNSMTLKGIHTEYNCNDFPPYVFIKFLYNNIFIKKLKGIK